MTLYREIQACRSCGCEKLAPVFDLGPLAISDFIQKEQPEDYAPIELVRCRDCTLVQLRHTVDRERLYRTYHYRSGTQEAMRDALKDVWMEADRFLGPGAVWVDVGANDGYMLSLSSANPRLAFEPCIDLHPSIEHHGGWIAGEFFPPKVDNDLVGTTTPAQVITSIACFYDVDDPNEFVEGIKLWLADDGVWINQMSYLPATLEATNFGDFCHEHLTYWSLWSFRQLIERHGLYIDSLGFNDVNGGSFRTVVRKGSPKPTDAAVMWDDRVQCDPVAWSSFRRRAEHQKKELVAFLRQQKALGKLVHGYGASTKGNTYLQYWGVGPDLLPAIADRNPGKHGTLTAGTHIPVISEEASRACEPAYWLVLPWHFIDSFKQREHAFLERGGKFVVPFPTLQIVGAEALAEAA